MTLQSGRMPAYNKLVKNFALTTIEVRKESASCWSIVFERPAHFEYAPGDWIDLCFNGDIKTFSFSSSPTEPNLMITYKEGLSSFKSRLHALKKGDRVDVYQYGNSGFELDHSYDAMIIAGGVGIAPFRSMVKFAIDHNIKIDMIVLYASKTDDFPFYDELCEWSARYSFLNVEWYDTKLKGRLKKKMIFTLAPLKKGYLYYIAGSPAMVQNIETFLFDSGVSEKDVMDDEFRGY